MAQSVTRCSKCLIEMGANDRVTAISAFNSYGVVNQPLPDNICPRGNGGHGNGGHGNGGHGNGGHGNGGHDIGRIHDGYTIKIIASIIFSTGVAFIFTIIAKCIFVLISNYNTLKLNTTFNAMDIYSFIVVGIALVLWITQRVSICKFDLLWKKIAHCFSHSNSDNSNHSACYADGVLLCFVDGLMGITFLKMVRRVFIGTLSTAIWSDYHRFSTVGFFVFFSYWILDIFLCYYEWTKTPDGKLCRYNENDWRQEVLTHRSQIGCYCCFVRICRMSRHHHQIPQDTDN